MPKFLHSYTDNDARAYGNPSMFEVNICSNDKDIMKCHANYHARSYGNP